MFSRLMSVDLQDLKSASKAWQALADDLTTAHEDHTRQVAGPLSGKWRGDSGSAALETLDAIEKQLEAAFIEATSFATVLDTVHTRLEGAQNGLRDTVRNAENDGLTVDDSGTVRLPDWLAGLARTDEADYTSTIGDYTRSAAAYQKLIDTALHDASAADDEGHDALVRLVPDDIDSMYALADAADGAVAADKRLGISTAGLPDGKDPKQSASWWRSLSHDEQQEYIATHPALIGRLDGLPSTARDQANRLLLDEYLSRPGPGGTAPGQWSDELAGLNTIKTKLDAALANPADKQLYLLKIDPSGDGQAIVAMGNPDTADKTGVLVPGTNTDLQSMPGQIDRIDRLYGATQQFADGKKVSVISWLGYDPPQESGESHYSLGIAGTGIADHAGASLRQFVAGTRAAQGPHHGSITVIGHSYGSTTVGAAAAGGHGLHADNIIVVGSPGTTVDRAQDLHIAPTHVFVGAAPDDPIINGASNLTLGPDPAQESFGGTRMLTDTHGHSGYWDPGSQSLFNQGRIIADVPPGTTAPDPEIPAMPPQHPWYH